MAGFVFKEFCDTNTVGTGAIQNVNLFTVPAGHTYIIKKGHMRILRTAGGIDTLNFERSNPAGANFRNIMEPLGTTAAANNFWVNLTPPNVRVQNNQPLDTELGGGASTQVSSMENLICEAGTIVRVVIPAGITAADNILVAIDGVDHTL